MKGYPKYKESGVEWLGEIPEHWFTIKLKYCDSVSMGQSPNSSDCNTDQIGLPFLQGNADFGKLSPSATNWCPCANKIADENDILLSVRAPIGAVNIADQKYGIGRGLCAIKAVKSFTKYRYYEIACRNCELQAIGTGTTYKAISSENVNNYFSLTPPIKEQKAIATFLDQKTAQIDSLIEKKKRMIELLKEERAAIINQAVTKGINHDAEMKDSGIEWLGEVPKHWVQKKLKYLVSTTKGFAFKSINFSETGIPVVRASDIKMHTIRDSDVFLQGVDVSITEKVRLKTNDIILSTVGSKAEVLESAVGQIGLVPPDKDGSVLNQNTVRFKPDVSKIEIYFLFYFIISNAYRKYLDLYAHGTANQASLNVEDMLDFKISLPSIEEQKEICSYISAGLKRIDCTIELSEREISLIEEYRTALINEAVTGKIDVRGNA